MEPVICDQAVFTCIRSPLGQGYRTIAASGGLRPDEAKEIARRSPSGDGLCDDTSDAIGVTFFRLPTGRHAVLHSRFAGHEPTGRGGLRAYTQCLILDTAALRPFRDNPFDVLRAAEAAGILNAKVLRECELPKASLTATRTTPGLPPQPLAKHGGAWIGRLAAQLLAGENVIVLDTGDLAALTEAIVLCLPRPLRAQLSFSCGLRLCPTRECRLTAVRPRSDRNAAPAYSRPAAWDDLTSPPPAPPSQGWGLAVQQLLDRCQTARLEAAAEAFTDLDLSAADAIGETLSACSNIAHATLTDLLRQTPLGTPSADMSPLLAELRGELAAVACHRVRQLMSTADAETTLDVWETLVRARDGNAPPDWLRDAIAVTAIGRMAQFDVTAAVRMTLAAAELVRLQADAPAFASVRDSLIERTGEWAKTASTDALEEAAPLLATWKSAYPSDPKLEQAAQSVAEALAERAAAAAKSGS